MKKKLEIPVEIAGVNFKNPFFVASGPTTKSVKQLKKIEEAGWAAASIKLTIDPAPYINRVPRYAIFKDRNALAFTAEKRLDFKQGLNLVYEAKKVLKELILFANITYAGDKGIKGWVNMAKKFEEAGADIIELNMCCPNMSYNVELSGEESCACTKKTGASLGQNEDAVSEIVKAIKEEIKIPLFVKLTPEGGKIATVAKALYAAGADAVGGTSNRLGIPPVDLDDPGKAVYHLQDEISMSCHSGAWLKPLALRDTFEIRKVNGRDVKITMAGGVRNYKDAAEMFMCGADLIGICAETLISGYGFIKGLIKDLKEYMDKHGFNFITDMRDMVVPLVKTAPELTLYDGYVKIKNPYLSAPCKTACPNNVPAQAYVRMVAKGDIKRAYELIMSKSPLQSVCGKVCNAECENECTRGAIAEPVSIRDIKRFVLDYGKKKGYKHKIPKNKQNNKKVAVIGSGPAGISCSYALARAGYDVTVFEKENEFGGMLRYALPGFRIDRNDLDEELDIVKGLGVKFKSNVEFNKDISYESLKEKGYEAVFMGTGAANEIRLDIDGEDAENVYTALGFLKSVYNKKPFYTGNRTIVIGGGFTAFDSARTAVRLGAKDVYILYRRTENEMPVSKEEIRAAEEEGVKIMYLITPVKIQKKGKKAYGISLYAGVLGEVDETGRRMPCCIEESMFTLSCDSIIIAAGQKPDMKFKDIDPLTLKTGVKGVYAGGDAVKVDCVISAIAAGQRAAVSIDKYLSKNDAFLDYEPEYTPVSKEDVLKRTGYFLREEKPSLEIINAGERKKTFDIYKRVMTKKEAMEEAAKCLSCGCGEGCGICSTICSEFAVHKSKNDEWEIDKKECAACGMCYNRCPNENIEIIKGEVRVK